MRLKLALLLSFLASPAFGQGWVPAALSSNVDENGRPIAGGLLYVFANATTTPQTCYQDLGLTIPMPNPITADNAGRIPLFYCASGQVHLRFTTAAGDVVYDYPTVLVAGASGGGGGGGTGGVDPSSILSTGDIKFRQTSELLTGWVKLNGTSIGSASSGATQRANSDTQALFIYLWALCSQNHCPVTGGRGASGLADFSSNKTLALPDWRDMAPRGLDDMGTSPKGNTPPIASGGGDTAITPGAWGGSFWQTLVSANLPAVAPSGTITNTARPTISGLYTPSGGVGIQSGSATPSGSVGISGSFTPSGHINLLGSVSPTFTGTAAITGTQTINNVVFVGGTCCVYSGPASAGSVQNITINGSNFSLSGTTSAVDISHPPFSATFVGDGITANTVIGASFAGNTLDLSGITWNFSGNRVDSSTLFSISAGSYAFSGNNLGSATAFPVTDPFILGTWFMKL